MDVVRSITELLNQKKAIFDAIVHMVSDLKEV